jgi:predicted lipoprotein with Yx(FWY)xxD motif
VGLARLKGVKLIRIFAIVLVAGTVLAPAAMSEQSAAQKTLTVHSSRFGKVLFDGRGFVLYAFTRDQRRSACYGACAKAWPPYFAPKGTFSVGPGVKRSLLSTIKRKNGRRQISYAGRPLYYYVGDTRAGQILCQNVAEFGGTWLIVRPSGKLVR